MVAIRDPDVRCKILFLNALYGAEIVKDIADEILEIGEDPILKRHVNCLACIYRFNRVGQN